jgi:F-type H+-transporting ATPase subunit gamma
MNFRTVRKKTKSVKNVKKITKAMQMVSAVKMRKAVTEEIEGRPYRDGLYAILSKLAGRVDTTLSPLLQRGNNNGKTLVIYVSANKGLCGAFHTNLLRFALKVIDFTQTEFITIGSKGAQTIARYDRDIVSNYTGSHVSTDTSAIFAQAVDGFLSGTYANVYILYTQYISPTRSEVKYERLLPIIIDSPITQPPGATSEYLIEPSPSKLIDPLLRNIIQEKIRGAILSSQAVEHSMRMMAMKNATDNAEEVLRNLTLVGNTLRQTKITSELLDMVTAKESVENA